MDIAHDHEHYGNDLPPLHFVMPTYWFNSHSIEYLPHKNIFCFNFNAWHCLLITLYIRDVNLFDFFMQIKIKSAIDRAAYGHVPRFVCQRAENGKNEFEKSGKCNLALGYDKWWCGWSIEYVVCVCVCVCLQKKSDWHRKFALNSKCNFGNAFNQANGQTNLKIAANGFFNLNAPHFEC